MIINESVRYLSTAPFGQISQTLSLSPTDPVTGFLTSLYEATGYTN